MFFINVRVLNTFTVFPQVIWSDVSTCVTQIEAIRAAGNYCTITDTIICFSFLFYTVESGWFSNFRMQLFLANCTVLSVTVNISILFYFI